MHSRCRNRRFQPLLLALAVLTPLSSAVAGTTYYVASTGVDTNAGSSTAPWRTLQRAANAVHAGDTVRVRAGTYAGFVLGWDFAQNGTATAAITFQADPGVVINTRNAKTADGINLEGCSYIVVTGFTVNNTTGTITRAGIRSVSSDAGNSSHVTISNNSCDANGTWGIFTSHVNDLLIAGNRSSHAHSQHGIYVSNACVRPVVRGNILWGNAACGLHMNGDLSQGGTGLITNALVENNVIYDNGLSGGSAINCDGVRSSLIRNNLIYNAHAAGISLYQIDAAGPSINNVITSNTIDMASNGRWALQIHDGSSGCVVFNNILLTHSTYRGSIHFSGAADLVGLACDYNILTTLASAVTPDDDTTDLSLAQWQARGFDRHSRSAQQTALFTGWTTGNYHLLGGSVALDMGTAALAAKPAPRTDLESKPRPTDYGYEPGCYEFPGLSIARAATATPNPVTANTTTLSALGADPRGESSLTYTWGPATANVPASVVFSANGSNAAKTVTATFSKAGSYPLQVTIRNWAGIAVTSPVTVTVQQTLTSLALSPAAATLLPGGSKTFTPLARDQFGNLLTSAPALTWTPGGGTITAAGVFTAGPMTGSFTLTADAAGKQSSAAILITTNKAQIGGGYIWSGLVTATGNEHRLAAPGVNDTITTTDVRLCPSDDALNAFEAAGILWSSPQTVTRIAYQNGDYDAASGVFCAAFSLQYSTDGVTWVNAAGWTCTPGYTYNSPYAGNTTYTWTGPALTVRGIRCAGQVHVVAPTPSPTSTFARVTEIRAY